MPTPPLPKQQRASVKPPMTLTTILLGRCTDCPHFTDDKTGPERLSKSPKVLQREWERSANSNPGLPEIMYRQEGAHITVSPSTLSSVLNVPSRDGSALWKKEVGTGRD